MRSISFLLAVALSLITVPTSVLGQSPLGDCSAQFIDGLVENAPTIASSPPSQPFASNEHLCYRDDGVSFFAIEYWPQHFAPRWAAYKLDPENYGPDGCNTFTRGKANCYASAETWSDFLSCSRADDPFHPDHMLEGNVLDQDAFKSTGHDRGHIAPRQAMSWHVCATYQTFSMANMSPQRALLNQEIWQKLEKQVLTWAVDEGPLYVVTGTTFRSFPHRSFEVYTDGTFDESHIYASNTTLSEVVEQHSTNYANHPDGHILKPQRKGNPQWVRSKVKRTRMPTGYYKVVFRPAQGNEPPHAIGFLLPHTFENLNNIPGVKPEQAFWSFVARIDLIEETSGTRFPGIPDSMKSQWGDAFFFSRKTSRNIRPKSCGVGTPDGVVENTTNEGRLAMCTDKLN